MNGKDCTQCIHNDGCHIHCICHNQERFEPKEQPMSEICKDIKCEWYNPLMEYGCAHGELEQSCIKEKPKENKVIFESEGEFIKMMDDIFVATTSKLIDTAKKKGYIRKSAVEKAEEKWNLAKKNYKETDNETLMLIAEMFILQLKAENEKLKIIEREMNTAKMETKK